MGSAPKRPGGATSGSGVGEIVTLSDGTAIRIAGHLELVPVPGGVRPVRLPTAAQRFFPPDGAMLAATAANASGVRIMVRTEATSLQLTVRCTRMQIEGWLAPTNSFAVEVDRGTPTFFPTSVDAVQTVPLTGEHCRTETVQEFSTVHLGPLPTGDKEVVVWLPQAMIVDVLGLTGDAPIHPADTSARPIWVHHGSSISHGADPKEPTSTWPVVAARGAGLEVVNLGFSGQCMLDPFVADAIAATVADVISIKVGINIVGARSMDRRTFSPALHGFLDRVRVGHPNTPIVVSSSILWPGNEDLPGPSDMEVSADGTMRAFAMGNADDVARGALTLVASREQVRRVVGVRAALGEPTLYLDGLRLYGREDAVIMPLPDNIHPDAPIYEEMGRRFALLVFGEEGLVPARTLRLNREPL